MSKQLETGYTFTQLERRNWLEHPQCAPCMCPCANCYDPREDLNRKLNNMGHTTLDRLPPRRTGPDRPILRVVASANDRD